MFYKNLFQVQAKLAKLSKITLNAYDVIKFYTEDIYRCEFKALDSFKTAEKCNLEAKNRVKVLPEHH